MLSGGFSRAPMRRPEIGSLGEQIAMGSHSVISAKLKNKKAIYLPRILCE
jgi:hypothetical protein